MVGSKCAHADPARRVQCWGRNVSESDSQSQSAASHKLSRRCLTHPTVPVVFQQWPSAPCSSCCSMTEPHSADGSASQINAPCKGSWKRRSSGYVPHRSPLWVPAEPTLECTRADKRLECGCRI